MAPHSSTLAWKIPWTEEHGRVQSMGSQRVGHDWATSLSLISWKVRAWILELPFIHPLVGHCPPQTQDTGFYLQSASSPKIPFTLGSALCPVPLCFVFSDTFSESNEVQPASLHRYSSFFKNTRLVGLPRGYDYMYLMQRGGGGGGGVECRFDPWSGN